MDLCKSRFTICLWIPFDKQFLIYQVFAQQALGFVGTGEDRE